jgi:outer membrane protein
MRINIAFLFLSLSFSVLGQEIWGLERCIQQALQANFQIKQSELLVAQSKINVTQNQLARFPSLTFGTNLGFNFGRSVNPSTYQFENRSTNYQSLGLNTGMMLFNGGKINNSIAQSKSSQQASQYDLAQVINTVSLSVAQAYLQVLLNEEQLDGSKKRQSQTQDQLNRTEKLIAAGALAQNTRLDILAQLSRNEQVVITNQNNVDLSYFNLKQLLVLDPDFDLKAEKPAVIIPEDVRPELFILKNIYEIAVNNQPQIKAGEYRLKSAQLGLKVSKADLLPSLSFNGNLSSNYSSTLIDFTKQPTITNVRIGKLTPVQINGVDVGIAEYEADVVFPNKTYTSQLQDNFGQGLGFNLSIPIFENGRNKLAVQRANLNLKNQQIENEKIKQTLKADIQNAIFSAKAAKKQLDAAQKNVNAQKASLDNLEKRYQIGAVNGYDYIVAKTTYDTAENDLISSKYDYLFKLKIVDFYQGKKITLK